MRMRRTGSSLCCANGTGGATGLDSGTASRNGRRCRPALLPELPAALAVELAFKLAVEEDVFGGSASQLARSSLSAPGSARRSPASLPTARGSPEPTLGATLGATLPAVLPVPVRAWAEGAAWEGAVRATGATG